MTTETPTTEPTVRKLAEELIRLHGEEVDRDDISDHVDNHERGEEEHDALVDAIDKAITFAKLTVTFHGDVP